MSAPRHPEEAAEASHSQQEAPRLVLGGVQLGPKLVPLLSGAMHYWRLPPESWRAGLEALRAMGCTLVDTYVPWSVHELEGGEFDFGAREPGRDVRKFLRLAEEVGLYALVRPGPHINAELSGFGIPMRVLWEPACQARSPAGEIVVLPAPPLAFPVPSYASRAFLEQACAWLERVGEELGPLSWPHGPIVLCQIDNEGALYFRDGVYEQDYHADALALYRSHLERTYGSPAAISQTYGFPAENFELEPPRRFSGGSPEQLARQLDWAEHQEALIASALRTFRRAVSQSGLERVPTCHNLPMGASLTPLDPSRLGAVVDCVGIDYYHVASEASAGVIERRSSEVTTRADAFGYPAFAVELAAGFPPFFPPLSDADNRFTALSCLAAGIRGFSLYMAVERDRWIGSPIDRFGARRPSADFWQRLNEAVKRTRLFELQKIADVCVIVPRSLHRLRRLLHAFGPLSPTIFDILGLSGHDACSEDGPFADALFEAEAFLTALYRELGDRGIAYRVAAGDSAGPALEQSRFGFVVPGFGLEAELWEVLSTAATRGKDLRFGPRVPTTTPNGVTPLAGHERFLVTPASHLATTLTELTLRHAPFRLSAGAGTRASLFCDRDRDRDRDQATDGAPRVLFLSNPSASPITAQLADFPATAAVDALDGESFRARFGALEIPLSPQSVRMLELESDA